MVLHIEKDGLALALQMNIESPETRVDRIGASHQGLATVFRDQPQYGIILMLCVTCKIDASDQTIEQAAREGNRRCPTHARPRLTPISLAAQRLQRKFSQDITDPAFMDAIFIA